MTDRDQTEAWARHRRDQIRDVMRGTTPAQRLAWVEEMIDLARKVGARPIEDLRRDARTKSTS